MTLMDQPLTLHLRGEEVGRDPFDNPVYGDPTDVVVWGWFEPAGSTEDLVAAEQTKETYWVYTEDPRARAADAISLPMPEGPLRCELQPPQWQPPGTLVDGFFRTLVEAVKG